MVLLPVLDTDGNSLGEMDQSSSLQLPLPTHEGLMKSGKGSDSDPEVSPESLVYLRMSVVFTVVLCLISE